jgi:hypothetical protein
LGGIIVTPVADGAADVDLVVSDNYVRDIAGIGDGISVGALASATAVVTGNRLEAIGGKGMNTGNTGSNYLVSDNHLTDVAGIVFDHDLVTLLPGSTGNTYTDLDALPVICTNPASGILEVTVNGVLQTCPP